jgi:hypothetical protein
MAIIHMQGLLRDFLLSFCPAPIRRIHRPESTTRILHAAIWSGLAQFLLLALVSIIRFKEHFYLRAQQLAPHVAGTHEVVQSGVAIIIVLEYLLYPLSIFWMYLALEGFVRFAGGIIGSEVVPSLPVFLVYKALDWKTQSAVRRQSASAPPDTFEFLSDGSVQIAAPQPKSAWNASITVGINGVWYTVDCHETGAPPRSHIYILKPVPEGRVLRKYEEYDLASAVGRIPRIIR